MNQRSKHWQLTDYGIVRKKDRQDVRVTKIMCKADCRTGHRLVVNNLNLLTQPTRRVQGKKAPKKPGVPKLKLDDKGEIFISNN